MTDSFIQDIEEHLPVLRKLSSQCYRVVEFGTRTGNSTRAFLEGGCEELVSFDIKKLPQVDEISKEYPNFVFSEESSLSCQVLSTDLLFIDSRHTYTQLRNELARHSGGVKKWIVLHDTELFGERGEDGGIGLKQALLEFLLKGEFYVEVHYPNNNGLTVLRRFK